MIRISRIVRNALPAALLIAATSAVGQTTAVRPVVEMTSSGLITFSRQEKAIRVAAVFVAKEGAVVPTLVRFVDAEGHVLKEERGELREGTAVVAELTRGDVAGRGDLLVRVEVLHRLPRMRVERYPIIVSTQPIGLNGAASLALFWPGGVCGNPLPPGTLPGQPIQPGSAVMCNPPALADF